MHAPGNGPFFAVYYSTIASFGVPGRCGLSKCITRYLVFMAVADFLVIVTAVILSRLRVIYFNSSLLSTTPACSLIILLSWVSKDASVWFTVAFTFDRFVAICCQKVKQRYCTEKTAAVVIGTVCLLGIVKNVPLYFKYEPLYIMDNVPWYCIIREIYYTSVAWRFCDWLHRILNPCFPFVLISLLNAFTIKHIIAASAARKRLRSQNQGDKQSDPEMESRRRSIILLMAISGTFLLLKLTYIVNFLFVQISSKIYATNTNSYDPKFILQESGHMLDLLSSCTNSCIYAGTQTKFRQQLKIAVKYPVNVMSKCIRGRS
ncbi:probable G-protein coupled receptor 139 [Leucoraja erinacea]|uniref:probable G-protein coupled receptor 139 n=1 Tax=Leucoraja erinaceus TaxID=7782 RepID=UPI0024542E74|nr:probable G-protein coupled receptor 139 [Leucoraja erinacea]